MGDAGVWVHNAGGLCEEASSLFKHITEIGGLKDQPWEAFKQLMATTAGLGKDINAALPDTVAEVMDLVYAKAIKADGTVDISKIPTVREMKMVMAGRGEEALIDVHHTAIQAWTRILIPGISQAELDEMPGLLLKQADHRIGYGEGAFHKILNDLLPYGSTTNKDHILSQLQAAYAEFDRPNVWKAVQAWLITKGVLVP